MSQDSTAPGIGSGPGSGAAKPVTEPPGGALDRVLNDEPVDPDDVDKTAADQAED